MFKLDEVEKPLEHTSQMWGFSPVWVRKWRFNRLGRSKDFPHTRQGSIVLDLILLLLNQGSIKFKFPTLFCRTGYVFNFYSIFFKSSCGLGHANELISKFEEFEMVSYESIFLNIPKILSQVCTLSENGKDGKFQISYYLVLDSCGNGGTPIVAE